MYICKQYTYNTYIYIYIYPSRQTMSRRQPKLPNTRCGWPPTRS